MNNRKNGIPVNGAVQSGAVQSGAAGETVPAVVAGGKKRGFSDLFDTGYLRRILLAMCAAALMLGLLYYIVWHITGGFDTGIETTPALYGTGEKTLSCVAYIFRDERRLTSYRTGACDYVFGDGERVAAGALLLTAYENGDADVTARLSAIDYKIALLENSAPVKTPTLSYTKTLENNIETCLSDLRCRLAAGEDGEASVYARELLILLNRLQVVRGQRPDFSDIIAELRTERDTLSASLGGASDRIYAPSAGYFYMHSDGLEDVFSPAALEALTPSGFDALTSQAPAVQKDTAAVGKLATTRVWYAAVTSDAGYLPEFPVGEKATVTFSDSGDTTLGMQTEYAVTEDGRVLLVFSSEELVGAINMAVRRHNVRLTYEAYEGLRVPQSAVRYLDGYTGVYARIGNTVLFRVAEILGVVDGYAYIDADTQPVTRETGDNGKTETVYGALALYDEVVISGTGMRHGLIID